MSYEILEISESEAEDLKRELGAVVDRIRGQAEDGKDCGIVDVTAGPGCEDLSTSEEASEKIAGAAKARLDLVFEHPEFGGDPSAGLDAKRQHLVCQSRAGSCH